jgi:hypothetical protein
MKVRIAQDAFADQTDWRFLDIIIGKVADGWHVWKIEAPEAIEKTGWLAGRAWLRELFQKAALASAYPAHSDFPKRELLVGGKADSGALPPQQAAEYATTPLTILMENRFTDGSFIETVLEFLAPEEVNEQCKNAPESIRYDSPGGIGELPKLLADYAKKAREKAIPLRVVVFTDSDGEVPGELHRNAQLIKDACQVESIPCLVLSKRSIENYIPDEVLDAWLLPNPNYKNHHLFLDAVKRLNPAQRDHYPMKKKYFDISKAQPAVQALYQDVSDVDKREFVNAKGFGDDVIEKLRDFRDALTPEALRQRDGQGELDRLVALIAAEL